MPSLQIFFIFYSDKSNSLWGLHILLRSKTPGNAELDRGSLPFPLCPVDAVVERSQNHHKLTLDSRLTIHTLSVVQDLETELNPSTERHGLFR